MKFDPNKLEQAKAKMQTQERTFVSKLPAIAGGAIGGFAGAPFGLVGSVPAAGVGYATGEQLYRMAAGGPPMQPGEYGREAALAGAGELVGGGLMKGAVSLTKAAIPSILKTMQGIPNQISKWIIERGTWKTLKDFTKVDPALPSQLIESFKSSIIEGRKAAGKKYFETSILTARKLDQKGKGLNIKPVYDNTQRLIDEVTSNPAQFALDKQGLAKLREIKITLANYKTQPISVENALKIRQGLDELIEYPAQGQLPKYGKYINTLLKTIRRDIDSKIKTIPQIKKADKAFSEMAEAYNTAESLLSGTDLDTKVINMIKRGSDQSRKLEYIDKLVSKNHSQLDAIRDSMAKAAFKEPFRPSVPFGPLAVAGATTAGVIGGPETLLQALSIIPVLGIVTSPRLAGHTMRLGERAFTSLPATAARYGISPTAIAEYERMGKK